MNDYNPTDSLVDEYTPYDAMIDKEEPSLYRNEYREASLAFTRILTLAISYILESKDTKAASYGVAFALGISSVTDGKSMREIGRDLNLSHGTISVHAKRFRQITGLPPSLLQQDLDKAETSRNSRNSKLA